ncbi:hypothetical protein [Pseudoduganella namucuonensis]|uniref:hypothetical protein n=1 Tax=Pseudoduganella namucuonensis TaxID=1035707 RepID=UPI0015A6EA8F|nr:hypothetical protein [Pseudoduganella namucuonensis]
MDEIKGEWSEKNMHRAAREQPAAGLLADIAAHRYEITWRAPGLENEANGKLIALTRAE